MQWPRRLVLLAAAAVVGAGAAPGAGADAWKRPRPSDVPAATVETATIPNGFQIFNDYATPERAFASQSAVVHYVMRGINAPPLNDDDESGVPDYVERVGEAADTAILYYAGRGFRSIRRDSGGPDERPDLYVSRFSPGTFGVALPAARAEGGAYIAIANNLDPSAERSLGSLYGVVAHELFHLVQFSYFEPEADPPLASWTAEGTAAAMEARVNPDLDDVVATLQLRRWLAAPERSITSLTYGSQFLWRYLDLLAPEVLPAYLSRLAAVPVAGDGAAELASTFRNVTHDSFAATFHRFALEVANEHGEDLTPLRTVSAPASYRADVAPLAIHYVKLSVPRRGRHAVTVSVPGGRAGIAATTIGALLVVSNGNPDRAVRYVVTTR